MRPQPLIAGNWKMFGTAASLGEARAVAEGAKGSKARVALCPPATLVHRMREALAGSSVLVGGQNIHWEDEGAFTGDVSGAMLADAGASLVILGHSERRTAYEENNAIVAKKAEAALRAGLEPIICVGESLEQRKAGETEAFVTAQVRESIPDALVGKAFSVAYEPIWAIGTGLTPTLDEIAEVHAAIRATLNERLGGQGAGVPILYGGSVKPANAVEILAVAEVGGALVGGASLKAADFLAIVGAV